MSQIHNMLNNNLALKTNSSIPGSSLFTIMPLFILAGSNAQFEIPMNATRFVTYIEYLLQLLNVQ